MRRIDVDRWRFLVGDEPEAWAKGFDDAAWRVVGVPHDWSIEHEFSPQASSGTGYLPGGIGWYRAHVPLAGVGPGDGSHVRLVFHGVYKNARVWANGYHLGGRPSGYARFSFDLTEIVSYAPDDDLVLAVRVDHTDISDSRWYNGSGITRRVELEVHRAVHLADCGTTFTTSSVADDRADVWLVHTVVNDTARDVTVLVDDELRSLASGRVHTFSTRALVRAGGAEDVTVAGRVEPADLWSDEHPDVYRLTTTLTPVADDEAAPAHDAGRYEQIVGLRTVAFDADTGFSINGRSRTLTGVCLHEDAGCFGTAVPPQVWVRRLLELKAMGANAVRMAHNPHAPELYLLCDLLGFYVIDEAFDEWENAKNKWWQGHNVYPPRHQGYAEDFPAWHAADLEAMVDAHRNHPSVVAWSIGNEVDYPNDPYASPLFDEMTGNNDASKPAAERVYDPNRPDIRRLTTIAARLIDIVKAKDRTRPVTLAAAFPELSRLTGLFDRLDVVGYNYKEQLYEADHRHLPHKPLVGSENSHSYRAWRQVVDHDYVAGQFLWTGIDYLGEARGWPVHGSPAGVLDLAGFAKHGWYLRKSWWSDDPVAYLVSRVDTDDEDTTFWSHPVTRAWDYQPGQAVEVLCFSNCDELSLTVGDTEIPMVFDDRAGCWSAVTTCAEAPTVTARRGDVVVVDALSPRRPAARLAARVWTMPAEVARRCAEAGLPVDGLLQIEVAVVDAAGVTVDEDRVVTVEVDGGELAGLENGDLSDTTRYTEHHRGTFGGRLMVYVRGSHETAVRLTAPGLAPVNVAGGVTAS